VQLRFEPAIDRNQPVTSSCDFEYTSSEGAAGKKPIAIASPTDGAAPFDLWC
jgi:hypothetical protein